MSNVSDFPSCLEKQPKIRKHQAHRENVSNEIIACTCENSFETISSECTSLEAPMESSLKRTLKKRRCYLDDFEKQGFSIGDECYVNAVKELLKMKNNQIKSLQQRKRRLLKNVTTLNSILQNLKKESNNQ